MADEEQVRRLKAGVERWNEWRAENLDVAIDLSHADFVGAKLLGAKLTDADLRSANLYGARLSFARLSFARLTDADLRGAKLTAAYLGRADLRRANLNGATLTDTDLTGAKLTEADLGFTAFIGCDLSDSNGLEAVRHQAPSGIATSTLERTAQGLAKNPTNRGPVETFLRGAGVSEPAMDFFTSLIENPIEFYSCFISYNHEDKAFARRAYEKLQASGIRCFLDEHDIKPGDRILDVVDHAIRLHDKILLCCSETSLNSWWVKDEVRKAMERERRDGRDIIIPLMLDSYLLDGWTDGLASDLRSRLAADFTGWESDNQKFEDQFERVVAALRTEREAEL